MATLQEIGSESAFQTLAQHASPSTLFILYFHTPWAAPCAQMRTILTTLASTYPAESNLSFLSINAEELPDVSETFNVTAVPFIVLLRGGKTIETVSGSDATKVRAAVERYAGASSNAGIRAPLQATPQQPNGNSAATKNLSAYVPTTSDPQTAPANSSGAQLREELNERLAKLVKAAPVMLFMKGTPSAPQCGFSRQMVNILREHQVRYGFFNILAGKSHNDVREGLKVFSDWPTFPQLYTNGELVGGLDIVREELENDPDFFQPFSLAKPAEGPATSGLQPAPPTATA